MSFDTPLRYENVDGSVLRLVGSFSYHWRDITITVPDGFECDGQSYPRLLWFVDHPQGRGAKAGMIHDYLYWLNGRPTNGFSFNRKTSDKVFRDALIDSGVGRFRARVRYRALRLFGWAAWNKHRKRIEKENSMKSKVALIGLLACLLNGCAMQRAIEIDEKAGTTTKYLGIAWFNKTALEGLTVGKRTKASSHVFALDKGNAETQPEALEAIAKAVGVAAGEAAKAAIKP